VKTVAILGCGPAGLLAAHAAIQRDHYVRIFSKKIKSSFFGAMYLHRPIPALHNTTVPEVVIKIEKYGTKKGYAEKVYGDPNAPVSWDKFGEGLTDAWSLSDAYEKLWARYEDRIVDTDVSHETLQPLGINYDMIFSTLPAPILCHDRRHHFDKQEMWVIHGKDQWDAQGRMVYNGRESEDWYRYSSINGHHSWEFSHFPVEAEKMKQGLSLVVGFKPTRTNCDCYPTIHRLGRFGRWDKHVLTHHAYEEVAGVL
jgi:hypothetical protein